MAKTVAVQFSCTECGYTAGRWFGKCPGCSAFGTLVEEVAGQLAQSQAPPKPLLRLVDVEAAEAARIPTGVPELDRVLGGGLVPASLVLLGGEPGVGKSTLVLMALRAMSTSRTSVLITGEESLAQVKLRAERLGGAGKIQILAETELETVCQTLQAERPDVCVIDSVQTLYASELGSAPGSVAQVREAAARLLRVAKESAVATILVGHVTKDGSVAGPRVLEHLVDCVLQFEGDRYHAHRILRAVKNRFGSTNELGVFEMTGARTGRRTGSIRGFRPHRSRRARRRRCLRARGHAADPARDPGARGAERARDAPPRRDRHRPEAARDDRRGALPPRPRAARTGGRLRERRRRRPHRRAGRRSRSRARHRLRRAPGAGESAVSQRSGRSA